MRVARSSPDSPVSPQPSIARRGSLATGTTGLGEALSPMPRSTFAADGAGMMSPESRSRLGPPAPGGDTG